MKKTAILLMFVMLLSIMPQCVYAAVVDDSTDGVLEWQGYTWKAICVRDDAGTSMIYDTQPCPHGWMYVDGDGYMNFQLVPYGDKNGRVHRIEIPRGSEQGQMELPENFDVEFEMQVIDFGESIGYQLFPKNTRVYFVMDENGITYQTSTGYLTHNMAIGYELHKWKTEIREMNCTLFMDGQKILSFELPDLSKEDFSRDGTVRFYGTPYMNVAPKMQLHSFSFTPHHELMSMIPKHDAEYFFGEDVELRANVTDNPQYVNYFVGEVCIGTATAESGYTYTFQNPKMGSYNVYAVSSAGQYSSPRIFTVIDPLLTKLVCDEKLNMGESLHIEVENEGNVEIKSVDYYLNGAFVTRAEEAPFSAELMDFAVGANTVYATVNFEGGQYTTTDVKLISVDGAVAEETIPSTAYEVSYTASNGGTVTADDGYFVFNLIHGQSGITYEGRDGSQVYTKTANKIRAVVNSGIADVYCDGKLAFSYYMPRSQGNKGVSYSGVTDVKISSNGTKAIRYRKEYNGETTIVDENLNCDLYYSLEFDKKDSSNEVLLLYDGEYELSLNFGKNIVALVQPTTEVTPSEQVLADKVQPAYYRVTVFRGVAQLFADNRFVASFRMPKTAHKKALRRVVAHSDATSFIEIRNSDDVFYHSENFEGGVNDWSEYWYRVYGDASAIVENGKMKLNGKGTYLFDATAENPELSWKMSMNLTETEKTTGGGSSGGCEGDSSSSPTVTIEKSGEVEFKVRYRSEYENVKVRYSHSEGKWTLVETIGGVQNVLATVNLEVSKSTNFTYYMTVKDDKLTFKCESNVLFDNVPIGVKGNGKFGFSTADCESVYIDNFEYCGNGKPNTGVNYSWWSSETLHGTIEFFKGDAEGSVYAYAYPGNYSSTTDNGDTWSEVADYSGVNNIIYLESGRKLSVSDWSGQSHAKLYEVDGTPVFENKILQASGDVVPIRNAMSGRLMQSKKIWGTAPDAQPRIFYVTSEGAEISGFTRVYYSDDEGATWSESSTVIDFKNLGNFYFGEADIIDMPDDSIRVYGRTDRGFLHYVESFDGGKTFSTTPKATQFIAPSTAFSIERDRDKESTYYIIWEYDVTTASLMYIQMPRNRAAMAVSYDGCESWEYIMEMDDLGPERTARHMNASLRVIDGIVYANQSYDDEYSYADDMKVRNMVYVLDPSKITTVKRFSNAHIINPDFKTVYEETPSQVVFPKSDGNAMIYGKNYQVCSNNGMADVWAVALAVGASVTTDDNGVTLSVGDGKVSFTKGEASYKINGETFESDKACLSQDGAYLDLAKCAEIFGKKFIETDSSYLVLTMELSDTYQKELANLVAGISGNIDVCIEKFKNISDVEALKAFFEEYKGLLNLPTDFSDKSYENMYTAYTATDMDTVKDYDAMMQVLVRLVNGESGRVSEFIENMNMASQSGDINAIEEYLTDIYADLLSFEVETSLISNKAEVFKKMTGIVYESIKQIEEQFNAAYLSQQYVESGRNNSVAISTVSRAFEGWVGTYDDTACGVTTKSLNGENVALVSAYEKLTNGSKTALENQTPEGIVYIDPETFDEKSGSFKVTGTSPSKSNTMITVFDMTMPENKVTATFGSGTTKAVVEFTNEETSLGEIPRRLKDETELTYRAELSVNMFSLYVKAVDEDDTEYEFIGTMAVSATTKTNPNVEFVADETVTVSDLGIYSHLPGVKYDTSYYVPLDTIHYTAKGTDGSEMDELAASKAGGDGIIVDEETGEIVITAKNGGSNRFLKFGTYYKNMSDGFDRAVIDLTVSVGTGGNMYVYYCDNANYRYGNVFNPTTLNGKSAQTDMTWGDGKYYNMRLITNVLGYDKDGQTWTYATLYAKPVDSEQWVCVAHEVPLARSSTSKNKEDQFLIGNLYNADIRISDISIKTYKLNKGSVKYANSVADMPEVDYVYSFDYMRMDEDTPSVFTIGGIDYGQTFEIGKSYISTDTTDSVKIDFAFEEDKWYRFYGVVRMVPEKTYSNNKTKIVKNTLTMYMTDESGNTFTIFNDLPMLKMTGRNGISMEMPDTDYAGVMLKNVRVYCGMVTDAYVTSKDGQSTIIADFLNTDSVMSADASVFLGNYANDRLIFARSAEFAEDVEGFGFRRFVFEDIPQNDQQTFKIFVWKKTENMEPVTSVADVQQVSK